MLRLALKLHWVTWLWRLTCEIKSSPCNSGMNWIAQIHTFRCIHNCSWKTQLHLLVKVGQRGMRTKQTWTIFNLWEIHPHFWLLKTANRICTGNRFSITSSTSPLKSDYLLNDFSEYQQSCVTLLVLISVVIVNSHLFVDVLLCTGQSQTVIVSNIQIDFKVQPMCYILREDPDD